MVYTIISNIKHNEKRMAKLRAIKKGWAVRDKAEQYVIGEAALLKVKLTKDEIIHAAVQIANAV